MRQKQTKQLLFDKLNLNSSLAFGGDLLKNSHAKVQRPISIGRPMHLVLRSSQCKGGRSLIKSKNARNVEFIINRQATIHKIRIYKIAKAYNHIHIVLFPKSREGFISFLRATSGLIARKVLGSDRGVQAGADFWDKRPWTRIISSWTDDFRGVLNYLEQNTLEAFGFIPYQSRKYRFSSS
jgi:hypothetical protein